MTTDILKGLKFRSIGPTRGGRVVAVAGDPRDIGTFYFGSTGGGVWKTDDAGLFWRNVSDGFFKRASVGALAVAHVGPERDLRRDGRDDDPRQRVAWRRRLQEHRRRQDLDAPGLEKTRGIGEVRVHPGNPDLVYVAALRTRAWAEPGARALPQQRRRQELGQRLFRSEQGRAPTTSRSTRTTRASSSSASGRRSAGRTSCPAAGRAARCTAAIDGGETFEDLSDKPGMPQGDQGQDRRRRRRRPAPAASGRMVEHEDGGVFRSDDCGDTWQRICEDRDLRQRAWYYRHIFADPQDPETVWVLNVETWRSIDGGKTFQQVPVPHGDNHDLWFDPANPRRMIIGNDGGGTVSLNGGVSWSTLYNQPTAEFYHVTVDNRVPYRVYGAQQDNTTMSVPSQSNFDAITFTEWYEIGGGESGYIAVRPDDPNVIYAGSMQGYLTRYDHGTGQLKNITVWPESYIGWGAQDMKYRFQWTSPTILSPHDPSVLHDRRERHLPLARRGALLGDDLRRPDPRRPGDAGPLRRADHQGQHRRRGLRHRLQPSPSRRSPPG